MNIFYELLDNFFLIRFNNTKFVRQKIYENILTGIKNKSFYSKDKNLILLNEKRFNFFSFDIDISFDRQATITDIKKIITDKKDYIKQHHGKSGENLFVMIENIFVDGIADSFVIGKQGKLRFDLNFIFLNLEFTNILKSNFGNNFLKENNLTIYPESFFSINYIKENINKKSFTVLYIYSQIAKLVVVENGFFKKVEDINFGYNNLKSIYKENNIFQYFMSNEKIEDLNDITIKLINNSLDFYCESLCKWIKEVSPDSKELVVITDIYDMNFFKENMAKHYLKYLNSYMFPFNMISDLKKFNKKRKTSEFDTLVCLNKID